MQEKRATVAARGRRAAAGGRLRRRYAVARECSEERARVGKRLPTRETDPSVPIFKEQRDIANAPRQQDLSGILSL